MTPPRSQIVMVRLTPEEIEALDEFRRKEKTIRSRSAVVREGAMRLVLAGKGLHEWLKLEETR